LNEDISDPNVFTALTYSMKGSGTTLIDRAIPYMKTLPADEVSVIVKEYSKYIENGLVIDGLVAGIGAYMAFLLLNENGAFSNQMPFQFGSPCAVHAGNTVNHNMFSYLSLPLTALSRTATGILSQLVVFIQSFINIWDPLFAPGPIIGGINEARMCMEVISGYSNHVSASITKAQSDYDGLVAKTKEMESRLQGQVDDAINRMRREINNLLIETKTSIREISHTDEQIKHAAELESQVKALEVSKPVEVPKPVEAPKPVEVPKPVDKLVEVPKPVDKLVEVSKPACTSCNAPRQPVRTRASRGVWQRK
jgi:hypothetical protein